MLRVNTYGPDLLDGRHHAGVPRAGRRGDHPQVRRGLREERPARRGDGQAGRARRAPPRCSAPASPRSTPTRPPRWWPGRSRNSYPKSPGSDERVRDRAGAVPRPGQAGQGRRARGWSTTSARSPAPTTRGSGGTGDRPLPAPTEGATPVTPTWYDLLGVEPDASADEIRAAWKAAIADLDPARPPVPDAQPGRRGAARPGPARRVRRERWSRTSTRATATWRRPSRRTPRRNERRAPDETHDEPDSRTAASAASPPGCSPASPCSPWLPWLAAAGYLVTQPSDDAIADATSDAQGAAERAAATILSYDYRHLDEDQKAAGALMTAGVPEEVRRSCSR